MGIQITVPAMPNLVHHFLLAQNIAAVDTNALLLGGTSLSHISITASEERNLTQLWALSRLEYWTSKARQTMTYCNSSIQYKVIEKVIDTKNSMLRIKLVILWICFEQLTPHEWQHQLLPVLQRLWYQRNVLPASPPIQPTITICINEQLHANTRMPITRSNTGLVLKKLTYKLNSHEKVHAWWGANNIASSPTLFVTKI